MLCLQRHPCAYASLTMSIAAVDAPPGGKSVVRPSSAHLPLHTPVTTLRSQAPAAYPPASAFSGLFRRFRPFFLAGLLVLLLFRVLAAPVRSLPPSLSAPLLASPSCPAPRRAPTSLRVVVAMPGGTRRRGKLGCCAKKKPRLFANSVALSLSLGRRDGLRPAARALRRRMRRLSSFLASLCSLSSRASYGVKRTGAQNRSSSVKHAYGSPSFREETSSEISYFQAHISRLFALHPQRKFRINSVLAIAVGSQVSHARCFCCRGNEMQIQFKTCTFVHGNPWRQVSDVPNQQAATI